MKKYAVLLVALLLSSCYTFDKSLLLHSRNSVSTTLLPLQIGPQGSAIIAGKTDTATVNSDFITLFTRELENNVFAEGTELYGNIELVIAYEDWRYTFLGYLMSFFSGISLFSLNMLGLPENQVVYDLQIDIVITSNDGSRVRKYSFDKTKKTWVGPFYYNGGVFRRREIRLELLKDCIDDFKQRINLDAENINKKLVNNK